MTAGSRPSNAFATASAHGMARRCSAGVSAISFWPRAPARCAPLSVNLLDKPPFVRRVKINIQTCEW
jgi:hypothetical protein